MRVSESPMTSESHNLRVSKFLYWFLKTDFASAAPLFGAIAMNAGKYMI